MGVAGRRAAVSALVVLALCVLVACGGGSSSANPPNPPANAAVTVTLKNIAFNPPTVTIKAGQTVAWWFDDGAIVHNVTADDGSWHSSDQNSGYYTHTFTTPGTYKYNCTIHSGMSGTVVVLPASAPTTASTPTTT